MSSTAQPLEQAQLTVEASQSALAFAPSGSARLDNYRWVRYVLRKKKAFHLNEDFFFIYFLFLLTLKHK
jgi:hypothetical protein